MAHIAVLDYHQRESDKPLRFVKRSAGQTLVNRAVAYWVIANAVLKLLPPYQRGEGAAPAKFSGPMPSGELPGLRFDDPVKKPNSPRVMFLSRTERAKQFNV